MRKRTKRFVACCMAVFVLGQTVAAVAGNNEKETQIKAASAGTEQELTNEPKALPVKIGKKVADKEICTTGISTLAGSSCVVSSKSAFIKKMHDYMNARKTSFSITFKGAYTKIYNGSNGKKLFTDAWNIDNKNTSSDFDYLYGCIDTYGFNIPVYSKNKSVFKFKVTYREGAAKLAKVNKKVKTVLKSLNLTGMSRVGKVKKIHDYIAKKISYDYSLSRFTAYDGLVSSKHSTVCQGYANLFYKMCTDAGIPCRIILGNANGPHAWNLVKIGTKWYFVDVTWDDPDKTSSPVIYDYFLVGTNKLYKDHQLDPEFRTSSFKKKYPIASGDYDWKTELTTKSSYKKDLIALVDTSLDYANADEVEKVSCDAYRQTMKDIVDAMSDTVFKSYVKGGTSKMRTLISTSWSKWLDEMETPVLEYVESDTFLEDREAYLLTLYTEEQLSAMSDEEYGQAVYEAGFNVYKDEFNRVYQEKKSDFIKAILA